MQSGVIEQRAGRVQPAIEVHHLVVCIYIVVLCNLSHPSNHHTLQDPAQHQVSKNKQKAKQ